MSHWANELIGKPYEKGACGPEAFDCWGLVRFVLSERYRIEVPVVNVDADDLRAVLSAFKDDPERSNWEEVKQPKEGDVVSMSHNKYISHVGIWLDVDGGGVLHAVKGVGVIFGRMANLKSSGWSRVQYWKHKST